MSAREFMLPDLGEGLTESDLVSWEVSVGDTVELNQIIAEVETAKALVQLPSPYAGTVSSLLVEAGTTVRVGQAIMAVDVAEGEGAEGESDAGGVSAGLMREAGGNEDSDDVSAGSTREEAETAEDVAAGSAPEVARNAVLVGYGPLIDSGERPRRRHRRAEFSRQVTEAARAAAADERHAPQHPESVAATAADRRRPIAGVQRRMAEAMVSSAFTAPHATVYLSVDVTPSMELLQRLRADASLEGRRPGILALAAKASLIAMRRTPAINSRWDEDNAEIVEFGGVNLGIAAATPRGLLVPVIRGADSLSFAQLLDALTELTAAAREGTTAPAQLSGGTFTITNIGVFGVDTGTPILTPGEAAILALGSIRRQPWEHDGGIALREVLTLSLSFDHRLVDGGQGARFLADVGSVLADPGSVLTML